ncbi:hypothetical protein ENBRE01_2437 [Enteropsectra breve]|nr:hypothetical protein ENBRE01_2437 [Enteropsectra breve]
MITSLGLIKNEKEFKNLKKFTADPEVKKRLEYLQIPLVDEDDDNIDGNNDDSNDDDSSNDDLDDFDKLLFYTPNAEEISSLGFYAMNEHEMFIHHDNYVFSTILDGTHLGAGKVALATFEPDIFIYDAFTEFQVLPERLLVGHTAPVTGVKMHDGTFRSCSEDGTVREWDLELMAEKNSSSHGFPIDRFDFAGKSQAVGAENNVIINGENIVINSSVENIKFNGENHCFVLDGAGHLHLYDTRNMERALFHRKIHEEGLLDAVFMDNKMATSGFDKKVKIWNLESIVGNKKDGEAASYEKQSAVFSMAVDENGHIYCGQENDEVSVIRVAEDLK